MRSTLKSAAKSIISKLPWRLQDVAYFYSTFGRLPRIKNPRTLNEHITNRKWTQCHSDPTFPILADKFAVRAYVEKTIGSEWLIPLIRTFNSAEELKAYLPQMTDCVLKPNHGAGMVMVFDCAPPPDQHLPILTNAQAWLGTNYALESREAHYGKIDPTIVLEKRIGTTGSVLRDFKIHTFNDGTPAPPYVLQVIEGRFAGELDRTFYLSSLESPYTGSYLLSPVERELLVIAHRLSLRLLGPLTYARVDWFIDDEQLYFGEITLTPASGLGTGYGPELDQIMGHYWSTAAAQRSEAR